MELSFEQTTFTVTEGDTLSMTVLLSSHQQSQTVAVEVLPGTATGELSFLIFVRGYLINGNEAAKAKNGVLSCVLFILRLFCIHTINTRQYFPLKK